MQALAPAETILGTVSLAVEAVILLAFGIYMARRAAREG
jgi:hypothetical protein